MFIFKIPNKYWEFNFFTIKNLMSIMRIFILKSKDIIQKLSNQGMEVL